MRKTNHLRRIKTVNNMETSFCIVLNIRTVDGYGTYGRFLLGKDREFANDVFSKLKGEDMPDERSVLHIDMIEMKDGLPFNLKMLACTLDQLAQNIKIITREVFKAYNLKEM
jgi:hypothetical protein